MRSSIRSSVRFVLVAFLVVVSAADERGCVSAALPNWNAVVSPAGSVRLERGGKVVATITPGLYEHQWQSSALSEAKAGQVLTGEIHQGKIVSATGKVVEVELQISNDREQARFQYLLTPISDIRLNSLHVSLALPTSSWAVAQ